MRCFVLRMYFRMSDVRLGSVRNILCLVMLISCICMSGMCVLIKSWYSCIALCVLLSRYGVRLDIGRFAHVMFCFSCFREVCASFHVRDFMRNASRRVSLLFSYLDSQLLSCVFADPALVSGILLFRFCGMFVSLMFPYFPLLFVVLDILALASQVAFSDDFPILRYP